MRLYEPLNGLTLSPFAFICRSFLSMPSLSIVHERVMYLGGRSAMLSLRIIVAVHNS
ncbi:hypothetical protein VIBNISOn1_p0012 [Vibrio nigripulchritudo SOn1]|uniref:Uncharacterized protein n=1 Tax=Vibrio nigripulchritudo SOn1 TaxID=1238450 RepID=A0AAV2VZS8_9VIBR|nr:hypothetical protein VIBNISOn1_p0012 [Vibrio nigripulchritudo SOn1]